MELVRKNSNGKVTHIMGIESRLIVGLLLISVAALGIFWVYLEDIFSWLAGFL